MSVAAAALKTRPVIFVCDIQEKFRKAIYGFDELVLASQKVLKAASVLSLPVYVTTQNKRGLGETVSELDVSNAVANVDKTKFSMYVPDLVAKLPKNSPVAIVGLESHVCVLQTTRDLINNGHQVYLLADAISSVNKHEKPIALARMAHWGAQVTTTESFIYEVMQDASIPEFKKIVSLVKEEKENNIKALEKLVYHL